MQTALVAHAAPNKLYSGINTILKIMLSEPLNERYIFHSGLPAAAIQLE